MKFIYFLFVGVVLLASCKKDKEPSKTDLLVASTWKYDDGGIDQNMDGNIDIPFSLTGMVMPCMTDNTGTFFSNGTGNADEGPTKCDPSIPQTSPFTWSFQNNETEMEVYGVGLFGLGGRFDIHTLTESRFTISKDTMVALPGSPPLQLSLILHLKH